MLRDILTNKWVISGIAFLIVFAAACVLWYQHDTAPHRKAAAETERIARQWENTRNVMEDETNTPLDGTTESAVTPITNTSGIVGKTAASTNKVSEPITASTPQTETADERVSPHGFGPYPTLPIDWPQDFWDTPKSIDHELHARVWIKLLEEGKHVQGMTTLGKLVYPIIKGVRYVKWEEGPTPPDGKIRRYLGRNTGHPDDDFPEDRYGFTFESDIPSSIQVISYEDGGIDPYIYLNLKE